MKDQDRKPGNAPEDIRQGGPVYDERVIKWVPIVVPLFAVMLVVVVYLIGASELAHAG